MIKEAKNQKREQLRNKLEVSLECNEAVIRLSSFVDGLGWCSQKTMRLDIGQLDELQEQIDDVRRDMNSSIDTNKPLGDNVFVFPKLK